MFKKRINDLSRPIIWRNILKLHTFLAFFVLVWSACGKTPSTSQLKIIGGTQVEATDPIAMTVQSLVSPDGKIKCSAASLTTSKFLTAAHCVMNGNTTGWTIESGVSGTSAEVLSVASAHPHPDFNYVRLLTFTPTSAPNDIAVITTTTASLVAKPVAIITTKARDALHLPITITLAGFGRIDGSQANDERSLQRVDVPLTSNAAAISEMTTTADDDNKMGCEGDSGGPGFYQDRVDHYVLIGVVSRGDRNCQQGKTVLTDVVKFSNFISNELNLRTKTP